MKKAKSKITDQNSKVSLSNSLTDSFEFLTVTFRFSVFAFHSRLKRDGFTLVELLITITLIVALVGFSIPSFTNFTRGQNLRQAVKQLKTDLRSAQNKAVNGVDRSNKEGWGVSFVVGQDYYSLCSYDESAGTCSNVENSPNMPEGVAITAATNSFVAFKMITGEVVNPSTLVTVGYSGGEVKSILIDSAGNIEEQ